MQEYQGQDYRGMAHSASELIQGQAAATKKLIKAREKMKRYEYNTSANAVCKIGQQHASSSWLVKHVKAPSGLYEREWQERKGVK